MYEYKVSCDFLIKMTTCPLRILTFSVWDSNVTKIMGDK